MRAHFYERSEFYFSAQAEKFIFYFTATPKPCLARARQGGSGLSVAEWFAWSVVVVVNNFFYGGDTKSYRKPEQP